MQFALYIVVIIYFFCNYFACVYRVVLVVFVSKDAIKSVPSNNNHLSPPLAASASCPSSTTGVRSGIGGETALTTTKMTTEDNPACLRRAGVAVCHSPCAGGHLL